MFIKLKDQYSFIIENCNIAVYDCLLGKFEFMLKVEDENRRSLIAGIQNPVDIEKYENRDKEFIKALIQKYLFKFIEEIPNESIDFEIEKNKKFKKFLNLYKNAFDLGENALWALIKESLYKTSFIFIGFKKISCVFKGYNLGFVDTLEEISFKEEEIYIINPLVFSTERIRSFERKALETNSIRLYVKENLRYLEIGPTLFAKDFGCYYCNDDKKHQNIGKNEKDTYEEKWEKGELSHIALSLIEEELFKISRKIIESLIEDITISKGKVFYLDKYIMEAEQEEWEPNVKCAICEGEENELCK